jgi:hypothetical protein
VSGSGVVLDQIRTRLAEHSALASIFVLGCRATPAISYRQTNLRSQELTQVPQITGYGPRPQTYHRFSGCELPNSSGETSVWFCS